MDAFIESLIQKQDKLFKMGALKNSKSHAFVVHESSKTNAKNKQKQKGKKESDKRKGDKNKSTEETSNSKVGKQKKDKTKCSYCGRGFHPESSCMKNTIDLMAQVLQ